MSDTAFTPGPWLIHETNRIIVQADGAFKPVTVKDGKVEGDELPNSICLLRDPADDFSEDETLANGFLIAAAPELYEALAGLVETLDDEWIEGEDDDESTYAYCDNGSSETKQSTRTFGHIRRARDALAKARGEVS